MQSSPRLWVESWETVEQLKGQQAGKDRGLWKSSHRIIPFLFKLRKLKMGLSDLHSLSSVMHFVRNATWTPWHKQNSLVAGSHFRGVASWLQGPPRHPTGLAHSQWGPPASPFPLCLASMPSQARPPQSFHDRNHGRQKRWGYYEKGFLKSNLTLPLTAVITPLEVAILFVEGSSPGACPAQPHRDGLKDGQVYPLRPCPHA